MKRMRIILMAKSPPNIAHLLFDAKQECKKPMNQVERKKAKQEKCPRVDAVSESDG